AHGLPAHHTHRQWRSCRSATTRGQRHAGVVPDDGVGDGARTVRSGAPPDANKEEGGEEVTVDVVTDIVIERPIEVVARYAADPTNAPQWYANIDSVEWKSAPEVAVGARVAFVARFLGRRLEYTYELVDYEAGVRLEMRTA